MIRDDGWSRRELLALFAAAGASACGLTGNSGGNARLTARPGTPTGNAAPGLIRLGTGDVHDGYLYVPASYNPAHPTPLVLGLHGAGGNVTGTLNLLQPYADSRGFLIVAVNSSAQTWDAITGDFGADVGIIDTALERAFDRANVDSTRLVIEGFSDGASYGLGLGLANGDLFTRIVAFSPGGPPDANPRGKPEVFISHGNQDPILPVDNTRSTVSTLQAGGYTVTYTEFSGGHTVPAAVAAAAADWIVRV